MTGNDAVCFEELAKEIARPLRNAVVIDMVYPGNVWDHH